MVNYRKLGNEKQICAAYDITFTSGPETGKNCILVQVGATEVLFNKDNGLDISWVKFHGINMSFLSKDGINSYGEPFPERFEGGFLYTCGMDTYSTCRPDRPMHGSLHLKKAEEVSHKVIDGEKVVVEGKVGQTALFGENLFLRRRYTVTDGGIGIFDTVENKAYTEDKYCLLYHTNFGHPFLDECLKIEFPRLASDGVTPFAQSRIDRQLQITPPVDGGDEEVFYNTLSEGKVKLTNEVIGVAADMEFDNTKLPVLVQWKSMISGDYCLGIEPAVSRFDRFAPVTIAPGEKHTYEIRIGFTKL